MIRNRRLWASILAIEVLAILVFFGFIWQRPVKPLPPPHPDVSLLDPISKSELETIYQQAVGTRNAETWRDLAEVYTVYGYFPEADICCYHAAKMAPNNFDVRFWWGVVSDRIGKVDQAIEQFTLARDLAPVGDKGQCSYHLGRNYLRNEDLEQAEKAFRAGAESYLHARYSLAKLLVELNRVDEAKPIIESLLNEHPDSLRVLQLAAKVAIAENDLAAAEKYIDRSERGVERIHSDELAFSLIGLASQYGRQKLVVAAAAQGSQGNFQQARQGYQRANESRWSRKMAWNVALMDMELGNYKQGITVLEELIARDGETSQRLDVLGEAYRRLSIKNNDPKLLEKAITYWQAATKFTNLRDVHSKLANYYRDQGDEDRANYHQALQLQTLGIRQFRDSKLADAQKAFFAAIKIDPKLAHSWYYLAELALVADNPEQAAKAYQRCLELTPHHGRAAAKLSQLKLASTASSEASPVPAN